VESPSVSLVILAPPDLLSAFPSESRREWSRVGSSVDGVTRFAGSIKQRADLKGRKDLGTLGRIDCGSAICPNF